MTPKLSPFILDGMTLAATVRRRVAEKVTELACYGQPGLAVIQVGDDPASEVYVRSKGRMTREVGMKSIEHRLPTKATEEELLLLVRALNEDDTIHGILVQLPLPKHMNVNKVINTINPMKDVDGFHSHNVGLLGTGQKSLVPCTPLGCLMMLRNHHGSLSGLDAVVIGRSNIVGKPMAQLLLRESCTVTIAHSKTKNIADVVKRADIVVAALGRPEFITGNLIKIGATVIDVGINRIDAPDRGEGKSRLVGDCHFESCSKKTAAITPVPGGVGPMTIACLLVNTIYAFCDQEGLPRPVDLAVLA